LLGIANRYNIRTVLDAGANEGQFALWSRKVFPDAAIYSFEPVLQTFKKLKAIAMEDRGWEVFQVALSDTCGDRQIFHHINHPSSSSLHESTALELALFPETNDKVLESVPCVTLDQWLIDSGVRLKGDVLLKLDVQGHESCVLSGAENVLEATSVVVTEVIVGGLYREQARFADIVLHLAGAGLHFQGVLEHGFDQSGGVISLDAVFMRDSRI
jgi:FkbM family methyltransferase